jgi:hypothetical protein
MLPAQAVAAAAAAAAAVAHARRWTKFNVVAIIAAGMAWLHGWMSGVAFGYPVVKPFIGLALLNAGIAVLSWGHPIARRVAASFVYLTACTVLMGFASSVAFYRCVRACARACVHRRRGWGCA